MRDFSKFMFRALAVEDRFSFEDGGEEFVKVSITHYRRVSDDELIEMTDTATQLFRTHKGPRNIPLMPPVDIYELGRRLCPPNRFFVRLRNGWMWSMPVGV